MEKQRIGHVELSAPAKIVGTISLPETLSCLDYVCDIVEVRLDQIGVEYPGWLADCKHIEAAGFPVILTLRLKSEGGGWDRADEHRSWIFETALRNISAIDVEWQSSLRADLCDIAGDLKKNIIVSYHNFERTPDFSELKNILDGMLSSPVSVPKFATMIQQPEDIEVLKKLIAAADGRAICVIGMGVKGADTRILFPTLGSCLAYGYLDTAAAPGQLSVAQLISRLRA